MTTATNRPMATEITQALDTPPHEEPLAQTLRPVFKKFLESLDYTPTSKKANSDLYTSMHWQALSSGVPYKGNAHSLESFNGAVAVAEVCSLSHREHTLGLDKCLALMSSSRPFDICNPRPRAYF